MTTQATASSARDVAVATRHRVWWVAGIVLLALTAFLMRNWLFKGGLPTSARKEVLTELAITWMFRQELLQGHILSEWNPTWFSGFPWLRFLSYPIYYTVAAFSAWGGLSLESAMILFYVAVMLGSGLVMFGYLRRLCGDWRVALVGAVIYEAFPYHNYVGVETWIHAAFWVLFPLPLWLIELSRVSARRRTDWLLLAGAALGLFPVVSSEYSIIGGPFVVLYLILCEVDDIRQGRCPWLQALREFVWVGLVALGTAAFFVLPAVLETSQVGIHSKFVIDQEYKDEFLKQFSVTPQMIWYAIARRFRLWATDQNLPWVIRSFSSISWYPGLLAPVLLLLGLGAVRHATAARMSVIGLLLAALLSTGPTFSLNFLSDLPILGRLLPFRGMLLIVTFSSILAAFGMQWILQRWRSGWIPWAATAGALLFTLFDFNTSASAYLNTRAYFSVDERQAYAWVAQQKQPGRLWEVTDIPTEQYQRTYSLGEVSRPRHLGYYDNGSPLYAWQQSAWTDYRTVWRLHEVRYVILRDGERREDTLPAQLREAGYGIAFAAGNVQVWENPNVRNYVQFYGRTALDVAQDFHYPFQALPEFVWREIAMVTPSTPYLDEQTQVDLQRYDYLLVDEPATRTSDPSVRASLEQVVAGKMVTATQVTQLASAAPMEVTFQMARPDYEDVNVQVNAPQGGVMSIAEAWYPHWRVWVDGQPQPVLRVNWALLGVRLEAGQHNVQFRYQRPIYVYVGYAVSVMTLLALLIWCIWHPGQPGVSLRKP